MRKVYIMQEALKTNLSMVDAIDKNNRVAKNNSLRKKQMKKIIPLVLLLVLLTGSIATYAQSKKLSDLTTTGLNPAEYPIVVGDTTHITGTIENAWNGSVSPNAPFITLQVIGGLTITGAPTIATGYGTGFITSIGFTVISQTTTKIVIRITDPFPAFQSIVFSYPVKGKAATGDLTNNVIFKVEYDSTVPGNDSDNDGNNNNISTTLTVVTPYTNPDINATFVNVPALGNVNTNDLVITGTTYGTPVLLPGSPAGATATINMNTDGTYSFKADMPGVYVYNVPVCSPSGTCTTTLLTISVSATTITAIAPIANTDIASTLTPNPVTLNTLANDNSMNLMFPLNPASVNVIYPPKHGTAVVDPTTGNITYTPTDATFIGNDTLFYQVCSTNTSATCPIAMQIITVLSPFAPNSVIAADDYYKTDVGVPVSGNILLNDTDPEDEGLVATPQTDVLIPGAGTYSIDDAGNFTFTPLPTFTTTTNFVYQVCDTHTPIKACADATVYIMATPAGGVTPLTIGFQSFEAKWSGNSGSLSWQGSGNETAGSYYEVQRSIDGKNYITIGRVNASTLSSSYSYLDKEVAATVFSNTATFYYRLQMVDNDGSSKYSNIEKLTRIIADNTIKVYPNPSNGTVHFNNLQNVSAIELWSSVGQMIQSISNVNVQTLNYNFNVHSSGSYIIVLRMEDGSRQNLPLTIVN